MSSIAVSCWAPRCFLAARRWEINMPVSRKRRKKSGCRRPVDRRAQLCPHWAPSPVATVPVRSGPAGPPGRPDSGPCWRCGGRCRTDKPLYGWVCVVCADEMDRYYVLACGLLCGIAAPQIARPYCPLWIAQVCNTTHRPDHADQPDVRVDMTADRFRVADRGRHGMYRAIFVRSR